MNTFKKKALYAAMLAGMGAAGTANAVHVNSNGTGQVLIYPYYTAQVASGTDSYITAFSVTNTSNSAKAVKVRFREGLNSREVLDFDLFLSHNDVWTGAVVATASGAKLVTTDTSCTAPAIPAAGVDFRNGAYAGATVLDGAGTGLDRTREGYFEMIELGTMSDATQEAYITHAAGGGAPANCAAIQALVAQNNDAVTLSAADNSLFGGASLIDVASGTDFTYDAVALADFRVNVGALSTNLGNESPNLADVAPQSSTVFYNGNQVVSSTWTNIGQNSVNAVSATLMHDNIMNEYVLDSGTLSGTDWVVNFPTKRYYVSATPSAQSTVSGVEQPFQNSFWNGSCDDVTINFWDREEYANSTTVDFSPSVTLTPALCWEANVVTFNNSNVLGSTTTQNIDVGTRQNGWAQLTFNSTAATMVSDENHTYHGLPVIGFMVEDFTNQNAAPGVMATYGGNFAHKATTLIDGTLP